MGNPWHVLHRGRTLNRARHRPHSVWPHFCDTPTAGDSTECGLEGVMGWGERG